VSPEQRAAVGDCQNCGRVPPGRGAAPAAVGVAVSRLAQLPAMRDATDRTVSRVERRALSRAIWELQGGLCWYCRGRVPSRDATLDHVEAQSRGGSGERRNLVVACAPCNVRKGNGWTHRQKTIGRLNALRDVAGLPPVSAEEGL
jgi:HNH endonuclease